MAHWYGNATQTALFLAPFAAMFGGLAQFTAGMWAFKARDGLATAMHGMWGSFWLGYGILEILIGFWASQQLAPARAVLLIIWVGVLALFRGITEIVLAFELKNAQRL